MYAEHTLTNTVRTTRSQAGLTQEQLAHAIGISRQTVIAIERGSYTPSVTLALRIAQHFNVPVEHLFAL